jgi:ribosome-associated protein
MAKTTRVRARAEDGAGSEAAAPAEGGRARRPAAGKARKLPASVAAAVRAALDKKATDLVVLDLRKAGGFTDFFVICTGRNVRQIAAIADAVGDVLKQERGERPALTEGVDRSEWILLDYFNFVVHIFSPDCRAFYDLERLWGNAERIVIADQEGEG